MKGQLHKLHLTSNFQADKSESDKMIVLFQTGYYVPGYGEPWDVDLEILKKLKNTFDAKVLGSAVSVYYGHWDSKRTAAGEIESLEIKQDGGKYQLLGKIKWTPNGLKAVVEREYKYISSEVTTDFTRALDSKTNQSYGPLLMGAALVNEPGVWDIPQIVFAKSKKSIDGKFKKNHSIDDGLDKSAKKEKQEMDELLKKLGFKNENELVTAFGALKGKVAELEGGKEKAKFEAELAAKESEIEALKTKFENAEKERFESEKKKYLDELFKAEKITKERYESLMKYGKEQFGIFKEIYEENVAASKSVLPQPQGTDGNDRQTDGSNSKDAEVVNLAEFSKKVKDDTNIDFMAGVR